LPPAARPPRRTLRPAALALVAVAILALAALVWWRGPVSRSLLATGLGFALGGSAHIGAFELGAGRLDLGELRVDSARYGASLRVARIHVTFDPGGLVGRGDRRLGVRTIELDRPQVVIRRRPDGSFGFGGGDGVRATAPVASSGLPWRLRIRIVDGSLALDDPTRRIPKARRLELSALGGRARIETGATSTFALAGRFARESGSRISMTATLDDPAGTTFARLRAPALPLAPIANWLANAPSARFLGGSLRDIDLRLYAFPARPGEAGGTIHVAGTAAVRDGALLVPGFAPPARGLAGRLALSDDALVSPGAGLAGRLGPLPVRLAGGLFDRQAPQFRIALAGAGDLADARRLFGWGHGLPVAGAMRLASVLGGPVGTPIVAVGLSAPSARYGPYPIADLAATLAVSRGVVDAIGVRGRYGGLAVRAQGALDLTGREPQTELVARATGGTATIPYLAQAAPDLRLEALGLLTGPGLRFAALGTMAGAGGGTTAAGTFDLGADGNGRLGPVALRGPGDARLAGTFALERRIGESRFWLDARDWPFVRAKGAVLPGIALVAPPFTGRLSGDLAGAGSPSRFGLAGSLAATDLAVGGVRLASAAGDVGGRFGNLRLANVTARGAWGAFAGGGADTASGLALDGRYDGDFARLATLTGPLGATGPVTGPVRLLVGPSRTVVQTANVGTPGARVFGLAIAGVAGTLAIDPQGLAIYGVTGGLGGGRVAAAGRIDRAGDLAVSVAGAGLAGAVALPLVRPGRLFAIGHVAQRPGAGPVFIGGAAVADARVRGQPSAANGPVMAGAGRLALGPSQARVGGNVGSVAGTVTDGGAGLARYDLRLHVPATALGPLAAAADSTASDLSGTAAADLRVRGRGARYLAVGTLAVPEGDLGGLAFSDATMALRVRPGAFVARRGHVTVGSTIVAFSAASAGAREAGLLLRAPAVDLTDFDDLFDDGDTLAGRGRFALRFVRRGARIATSADVALHGVRVRSFRIGDASAFWTSSGPAVRGRLAFGGEAGILAIAGTARLATEAPLLELAARSRFDGTATVRGLDLGVWLPAVGYAAPITGRLDADATLAGPLGRPDVRTTAALSGGSLGPFPVDRLTLAATSTARATTLERLDVALPSLALTGSGSFGLRPNDPLALHLAASSSDLGTLALRLGAGAYGIAGAGTADVVVGGTRARPRVDGAFSAAGAHLRGIAIPQAGGRFALHGREVALRDATLRFARGSVAIAGSLPLEIEPFGFGPPSAPLALTLRTAGLDLGDFAPLLPAGSSLRGVLGAELAIDGTAGAPRLVGSATLAGGTLTTPAELVPLEGIAGRAVFTGSEARLERLHTRAGSGTLDLRGTAQLGGRSGPLGAVRLLGTAHGARLDFPAYGSGRIDGNLTLERDAAGVRSASGVLELSDTTIPFSALVLPQAAANAAGGALGPPVGPAPVRLDLAVAAGRAVRVRSANVDIGARGALHVGGTTGAPVLDGNFASTGGTLTYVNTVFRLLDGSVAFTPSAGAVPLLSAHAITHVVDPDPNLLRNAVGSADVTLGVRGPLTHLTLDLTSDPAYGRQQILGLLLGAPALGDRNLFTGADQATPYGSTAAPGSPGALATTRAASGQVVVAQEAFGIANAQFTRTLLAPVETRVAGALGLSNVDVNVDYTGAVALSARKNLGKKLNAIYATSFGYPNRQTFGFDYRPSPADAVQVTVFQTLGAYGLTSLQPVGYVTTLNSRIQAAQPISGTVGFSATLQRLFP